MYIENGSYLEGAAICKDSTYQKTSEGIEFALFSINCMHVSAKEPSANDVIMAGFERMTKGGADVRGHRYAHPE